MGGKGSIEIYVYIYTHTNMYGSVEQVIKRLRIYKA